jgi:hypothetical protein
VLPKFIPFGLDELDLTRLVLAKIDWLSMAWLQSAKSEISTILGTRFSKANFAGRIFQHPG